MYDIMFSSVIYIVILHCSHYSNIIYTFLKVQMKKWRIYYLKTKNESCGWACIVWYHVFICHSHITLIYNVQMVVMFLCTPVPVMYVQSTKWNIIPVISLLYICIYWFMVFSKGHSSVTAVFLICDTMSNLCPS